MSFFYNLLKNRTGVKLVHNKSTADKKTVIMPPPKQVIIAMQQHIGAPCEALVKPGDKVFAGQLIADSKAFLSSPIYSSISGVVKKIDSIILAPNSKTLAIFIESDGKMEMDPSIEVPIIDTKDQFIEAIRNSALVGLGGAGFPTFVKFKFPESTQIDSLIINAAECEPYLTADTREGIENPENVFFGISAIKKFFDIKEIVIAIEDNKPQLIEKISKLIPEKDNVRIVVLKSIYPQGAEKVLIKSCTNKEVPIGKLPIDVGCVVLNISTISFLASYLKTGVPLISKRLTVDGSAIKNPQNVICPIGTSVRDVIEFCGGFSEEPKKILFGGPMMGLSLNSIDTPIVKQNNGILALAKRDAELETASNCIRCGNCVNACPMRLMPFLLEEKVRLRDFSGLKNLNIFTCMECGCCSYICPAKRPLVESIRLGKSLLQKAKKEGTNSE